MSHRAGIRPENCLLLCSCSPDKILPGTINLEIMTEGTLGKLRIPEIITNYDQLDEVLTPFYNLLDRYAFGIHDIYEVDWDQFGQQ